MQYPRLEAPVTVFTWRVRRAIRTSIIVAAAMLVIAGPTASAATAATPSTKVGYVRLAHLSPDTPDVDVYLNSLSAKLKQQVFPGVGYGTVSGYLQLPQGSYSVAMRVSGASPSTPPVLTTDVAVVGGHAYTVAGVGRHSDLGLKVISDDLAAPMNGEAKIRIIQASVQAPLLSVSIKGGATIATGVQFATTTSYDTVKAGTWTILVRPTGGGTAVPLRATIKADSVYSLVILDGKTTLTEHLLTDAARAGHVPAGSVATGGGGTADMPVLLVPALIVGAVALFLAVALGFRRRGSERWSARQGVFRRLAPGGRAPSRTL